MKKVIALVLALVMALSCGIMAFAEPVKKNCPYCNKELNLEEAEWEEHKKSCEKNPANTTQPAPATEATTKIGQIVCDKCGRRFPETFDGMIQFNNHILNGHVELNTKNADVNNVRGVLGYAWDSYVQSDIATLLSNLVDIFQNTGILEIVKDLINKIWTLIESAASQKSVAGAVSDLEAKVASLGFGDNAGIKEIINNLKQKIKSFYGMNEKATTVEATVAESPADTGSASVGIAAFAAVSVAAAAAYVCTKKKA